MYNNFLVFILPVVFSYDRFSKQISNGYIPLKVSGEIDNQQFIKSMEIEYNQTFAFSTIGSCAFVNISFPNYDKDKWSWSQQCKDQKICTVEKINFSSGYPGLLNCCCGEPISSKTENKKIGTLTIIFISLAPFFVIIAGLFLVYYLRYKYSSNRNEPKLKQIQLKEEKETQQEKITSQNQSKKFMQQKPVESHSQDEELQQINMS